MAREIDLNLLRVLVALDQARNVSRAAAALGMSQSGFSTALGRLRKQFHDELFIRGPGGMMPTARAQRMIRPAGEVLAQVAEDILDKPAFDPAITDTEFSLAMADVAEIVYLPKLLKHLESHAPGARVSTQTLAPDDLKTAMAGGKIDLAIGFFPDLDKQSFFRQTLYHHTFACIVREGHPLRKRMSIDAYRDAGHAVAASPARSSTLLEKHLRANKIERTVVLRTPHHLSLAAIVADTDLIATVPMSVAARFATYGGIRVLPLPFPPPRFAVQQHWHRLVHRDPRSQWLRAQIADLFTDGSDEWAALENALYPASIQKRAVRR
jgi:DNA-binding transcriptional LysR family regulator